MSVVKGCEQQGDGFFCSTVGSAKLFKKPINLIDSSDDEIQICSRGKVKDETTAYVAESDSINADPFFNETLTPMYSLNSEQANTISILKTGLDQISWKPLIGVLEDLAATGTVLSSKLHDCSTTIIGKILGPHLEYRVLQKFHSDLRQAEIILIESLIFFYVQDLRNKKNLMDHNQKQGALNLSVREEPRKRIEFSKEKKDDQPSYLKMTESFKRKQRSKCQKIPHRLGHTRSLHPNMGAQDKAVIEKRLQPVVSQKVSHSNNIPKSITKNKFNDISKCSEVKDNQDLEKAKTEPFLNSISSRGLSEETEERMFLSSDDVSCENINTNTNKINKLVRRKSEHVEWDQFEAKTVIKAYDTNLKMEEYSRVEKRDNLKCDSIYSMDSTLSNSSWPTLPESENGKNDFSNNIVKSPCNDFIQSTTIVNSEVVLNEDGLATPKKDNNIKNHLTVAKCMKLKSYDSVEIDELIKTELSSESETHDIFNTSNQPNELKLNTEKECSFFSDKTLSDFTDLLETSFDLASTKTCFDNHPTDNRNVIRKDPMRDNVVALRISEELMKILKEKFIITKRVDELSLDYEPISDNNNNYNKLPFAEFQKIRNDNNLIMKKLNLISTLTLLLLMSSLLSSIILFFSTRHYTALTTMACFFSWLFSWFI